MHYFVIPRYSVLSDGSKILGSNSKYISQLPTFYLFATTTLPSSYLFGFLEVPPLSPLDRLVVVCLGLETGGILTVDQVATGSFRVGIGGGLDLDWDPDLDPISDCGGMDSVDSSSKSSNMMEGIGGFVFH